MDGLTVNSAVTIPEAELRESFAKSGGPGGQHVNKTETKVELRWSVSESKALTDSDRQWLMQRLGDQLTSEGELLVTAADERSQSRNRSEARRKLAAMVRDALVRPRRRRATRPSRAAVERRLTDKRKRSETKAGRSKRHDD
ncbi:MAG: aminoacyl-tRNA hydrolase [Deltaproteobacteria bacterium]|nr:aminoacyl-tRNA hydrolase [Deltaproteobacteria bacterium]